jgi:hypothetical protein
MFVLIILAFSNRLFSFSHLLILIIYLIGKFIHLQIENPYVNISGFVILFSMSLCIIAFVIKLI